MSETHMSLYEFLRMFVVMGVIFVGYFYLILYVITVRKIGGVIQLLALVGLSAMFSFMMFRSDEMWSGEPKFSLALMLGTFAATAIFYMLKLLIHVFNSLGRE
ncbi:hypothetical protein LGH90_004119 [Salmonella enterica subsp. enterica serovar Adelaide]|nr:hypothetical protein [Salmonella enterica subsp. enterica serovar Adelaide]